MAGRLEPLTNTEGSPWDSRGGLHGEYGKRFSTTAASEFLRYPWWSSSTTSLAKRRGRFCPCRQTISGPSGQRPTRSLSSTTAPTRRLTHARSTTCQARFAHSHRACLAVAGPGDQPRPCSSSRAGSIGDEIHGARLVHAGHDRYSPSTDSRLHERAVVATLGWHLGFDTLPAARHGRRL